MEHSASADPVHVRPDETLSDLTPDENDPAHGPLARLGFLLGGIGLLGATAADALGVAGRHIGLPLVGAIELVQTAVVILGSSAMLVATLVGGHASVHIVTERLSPAAADRASRIASLVSCLAFLVLACGSILVSAELWNGFEQTELLHIPLRWLRLLWIVFAIIIAFCFARRAFRRAG